MKKKLMTVLALVLVIALSVAGTYAYLTSQDTVTNTFTVGNVSITMDEAAVNEYGQKLNDKGTVAVEGDTLADRVDHNEYKLVPSHTYVKDPTIYVTQGSEQCYIFAKIDNGLGNASTLDIDSSKWTVVEPGVYMYNGVVDARETAKDVVVFEHFTFTGADPAAYETTEANDVNITVTGYAVQADGMDGKTPAELWAIAKTAA